MKRVFSRLIAVSIIAFYTGCSNVNNGTANRPEYGHSSAAFFPFVDIMENMDKDITAIKIENDADRDFAKIVAIYHTAAIRLASIEVKEGHDTAMRRIARNIIKKRLLETTTLDTFLKSGTRGFITGSFIKEAIRPLPIGDLEMQSKQGQVDVAFATIMRLHEERVLNTTRLYLKYGIIESIAQLAESILVQERFELQNITKWLMLKTGHSQ